MRDPFGPSLLSYLCACLLLFLGLSRARPPIRNANILREDVAAIVTGLLLVGEVPAEHINSWHLMLGGFELEYDDKHSIIFTYFMGELLMVAF